MIGCHFTISLFSLAAHSYSILLTESFPLLRTFASRLFSHRPKITSPETHIVLFHIFSRSVKFVSHFFVRMKDFKGLL